VRLQAHLQSALYSARASLMTAVVAASIWHPVSPLAVPQVEDAAAVQVPASAPP
jgi:hypothetical protein